MSRPRSIGWFIVLVTLAAYLPVLRNGFVNFDDPDYVTENQMVLRGLTWPGIQWAFSTWHSSNWHPLTWISHMADCQWFQTNPAGHHLTNLLFHAANVALLFALWRRLTGLLWPSAAIAALFAWHPLHVQSVAWVAERKDVLSTFFALLALLSYVRWTARPAGTVAPRSYGLALLAFGCALMAKPMAVTLPFVMLLLDFWPLGRLTKAEPGGLDGAPRTLQFSLVWRGLWEKWPFFALSVASAVVTVLAQRTEAIAPLAKYSLSLRLENVVVAYAIYLGKTICPVQLAVFYPLLQPGWMAVALAAAICLGLSALAWRTANSHPYVAVGWLWYLGTLVPVIGLLQVGDQALADRYTYFPLVGIFLAAVFGARDLVRRFQMPPWLAPAASTVVLAGCLAGTEFQLPLWRDSQILFAHALAVTPDNATARLNLGEAFQAAGRNQDALANYQRALQLDPACFEAYNNIGRFLNDQGKPAEALEYCRASARLNPRSSSSHNSLAMVLAKLGRYDEALAEFSIAARLDPHSAAPHFQGGRALLKLGRPGEAVAEFQAALQIEPGNPTMMIYIARVLAADPHPQARNGPAALALARRAAALAGPPQPVVLDTLAMACAETGRFDDAANFARQAITLALAGGAQEDVTNLQQLLKQYEKHQPARLSAP